MFLFQVPVLKPMELMVEASPRRIFANAHTYHINSISVNSDGETYLSADDLRINLWHMEITDQSFNIVDIKPANMEELTEVRSTSCWSAENKYFSPGFWLFQDILRSKKEGEKTSYSLCFVRASLSN